MKITKEFKFEAAHRLKWHEGKCSSLHGHSYKLFITIGGVMDLNGIVMDFSDLKNIVEQNIIQRLDHKYLNDIFENPTAEMMVSWIYNVLVTKLPKDITLYEVKLYETETSYVTFS